jgi:tetratricopeptide (TPR) repeat protein
VYLWLAILLEAKGEYDEALKVFNMGSEINPMWDYLQKNKVMLLVNMNKKEEALTLMQVLIDKAHDSLVKRKRYEELSRLHWAFNEKTEALAAAKKSGNLGLLKFYADGDYSVLQRTVDAQYEGLRNRSEYISQLWMGIEYAHAGSREKALECFNNAVALKETAIPMLLIRDFEFLNIKYLSMALLTRKVKQLINF